MLQAVDEEPEFGPGGGVLGRPWAGISQPGILDADERPILRDLEAVRGREALQ